MKCKHCLSDRIKKHGFQMNGKQRYQCKSCLKSFQETYTYNACNISDFQIVQLIRESCGTRSISRIYSISCTTVSRRLLIIANKLTPKYTIERYQSYQVDELFTYVGNKENRVCIAYSYHPIDREVLGISVGRRNKKNLRKIILPLVLSNPKKITTDRLTIYKDIIPKELHSTKWRGNNHIERQNLTLRTHLKRLGRRTLCYSKSVILLEAIVKIYFWY